MTIAVSTLCLFRSENTEMLVRVFHLHVMSQCTTENQQVRGGDRVSRDAQVPSEFAGRITDG